jgi:hypothetical protein
MIFANLKRVLGFRGADAIGPYGYIDFIWRYVQGGLSYYKLVLHTKLTDCVGSTVELMVPPLENGVAIVIQLTCSQIPTP